jgi:hypothetical protein
MAQHAIPLCLDVSLESGCSSLEIFQPVANKPRLARMRDRTIFRYGIVVLSYSDLNL